MMEYMLERGKMYPIASYVVPQSKYEFGIWKNIYYYGVDISK